MVDATFSCDDVGVGVVIKLDIGWMRIVRHVLSGDTT